MNLYGGLKAVDVFFTLGDSLEELGVGPKVKP
jgi:hypothetical protein